MRKCSSYILLLIILSLCGCKKVNKIQNKDSYKIVFLSNRNAPKNHFDIFMMDQNGNNQINLTKNLQTITSLSNPQLSPNGEKILFLSFSGAKRILKLMNIEDHSISNVANNVPFDPQASFSLQGNKIVFIRGNIGHRQIFIVNSNGKDEKKLSKPDYDEFDPSFSSEGNKLIFVSKHEGLWYIYTVNPDGTRRKELLHQNSTIRYPTFSPDGREISFCRFHKDSSFVYLMNSNGTNLRKLVSNHVAVAKILFTLTGANIIYTSRQLGKDFYDICMINKDGKKLKNLTAGLNYLNKNPQLTPEGKSIIFESVGLNSEIYRVNIMDTSKVNLSNNPMWDQSPSL